MEEYGVVAALLLSVDASEPKAVPLLHMPKQREKNATEWLKWCEMCNENSYCSLYSSYVVLL